VVGLEPVEEQAEFRNDGMISMIRRVGLLRSVGEGEHLKLSEQSASSPNSTAR
jgi:hypothetical protein